MRLLLAGGTGFFGRSLLTWLAKNNTPLKKVYVLSRNPETLQKEFHDNSFPFAVEWVAQDILSDWTFTETVDAVIHCASESKTQMGKENPDLLKETVIEGSRNILHYAKKVGVKRFLYVSSGAVYGKPPEHIYTLPETFEGKPESISFYGQTKREAEDLCLEASAESAIEVVIARCFAFVGPYLPLEAHFAVGNFIRDGLKKNPILIKGNGKAERSYLESDDLAEWLLALLLKGRSGEIYNVGSDEAVSILDLAKKVKRVFSNDLEIIVSDTTEANVKLNAYLPDINKATRELNLRVKTNLDQALEKTVQFHLDKKLPR